MLTAREVSMIIEGIGGTLWMVLMSVLFGYILGLPMGILLTVTGKDGIRPNAAVYKVFDVISNIFRSIPFLILLLLVQPLTPDPGQELRGNGHHRAPHHRGGALHRPHGGVLLKRGGPRRH